jgi:nucleotide-binding universal stress UspA family protein
MDNAMLHRWGNPDTILVATNLVDAPHLVPHAIAQAKLSRAKILLVNVIEPSYLRTNPAEGPPFVLPSPTLRAVQNKLNEIVKQFQQEGVLCEPIALKGLPGVQIPALIHERNVDRVIVGTRSAEGLDRILLGSVADELLHEVDVPVCVVGPHVRPQIRPNSKPASILVATSFRYQSQPNIRLAVELAKLYQSHLTLVHVMSPEHASEDEGQRLRQRAKDELAGATTEGANVRPHLRL